MFNFMNFQFQIFYMHNFFSTCTILISFDFTKYGMITYNTDVWELTADNSKWNQDFIGILKSLAVINFKGINDSFSLLTPTMTINLNEKKWILWREALLIKHGQFDLNHMVASPQTFLVFMDFHDEKIFQTQELMLAFRLACCVTKHKDFLFPIYKGPCRILSKF